MTWRVHTLKKKGNKRKSHTKAPLFTDSSFLLFAFFFSREFHFQNHRSSKKQITHKHTLPLSFHPSKNRKKTDPTLSRHQWYVGIPFLKKKIKVTHAFVKDESESTTMCVRAYKASMIWEDGDAHTHTFQRKLKLKQWACEKDLSIHHVEGSLRTNKLAPPGGVNRNSKRTFTHGSAHTRLGISKHVAPGLTFAVERTDTWNQVGLCTGDKQFGGRGLEKRTSELTSRLDWLGLASG